MHFITFSCEYLTPTAAMPSQSFLQGVLILLNTLMAICAFMKLFSPHFEIMLLLSLGLTGCYYMYVFEYVQLPLEYKIERHQDL